MYCQRLLILVSALIYLGLSGCDKEASEPLAPRPVLVTHPSPAQAAAEAYPGVVRARHEPELAFRIGGKVSQRLVAVGERVSKDQPLAELDPEDLRLQLEAIRAQVAAAEANLQTVRTEYQRYQKLLPQRLVSQSQFDNIENLYRAGAARLKQVRAEYDVARNQAAYAVLRAPQAGIIASRSLEIGQVVAAGQRVFTLAVEGDREVLFSLPEQGIQRFHIGDPVTVELWAQRDKRFSGKIRELSPTADPATRTFAARVAFDAQVPAELGQSARIYIQHNSQAALAVPLSALSAEAGKAFVWVLNPQTAQVQRRAVQVAAYGENQASLVAGVQPGDWVVAAGVQLLLEGQVVRAVDRDNRPVRTTGEE